MKFALNPAVVRSKPNARFASKPTLGCGKVSCSVSGKGRVGFAPPLKGFLPFEEGANEGVALRYHHRYLEEPENVGEALLNLYSPYLLYLYTCSCGRREYQQVAFLKLRGGNGLRKVHFNQ